MTDNSLGGSAVSSNPSGPGGFSASSGPVSRACFSSPGKQRDRNEDACILPATGMDESRYGTLLAVADGVGGMSGGEQASQDAVQYLHALFYSGPGPSNPPERLRMCVEAVNTLNRWTNRSQDRERGYLTTLIAAVIKGDQISIANVGDSRAYLLRSTGERQQLSEDHSAQQALLKAGVALEQPEEAASMITRAIGLSDECQVDTYHYTWALGDSLVLCSDGLAALSEEDMAATVTGRDPQAAAQALVQLAVKVDGSDNCTAVVARWELPEPASPTTATYVRKVRQSQEFNAATKPVESPAPRVLATRKPLMQNAPPERPTRLPVQEIIVAMVLGLLIGALAATILIALYLDTSGLLNIY